MKDELAKIEILVRMMHKFSLTELIDLFRIGTMIKINKESDGETKKEQC